MTPDPHWRDRANCFDAPARWFFPLTKQQETDAKAVCSGCQVKFQCFEYALTSNRGHREQYGIFGGVNFEQFARDRRSAIPVGFPSSEAQRMIRRYHASVPSAPLVALVEAQGGAAAFGLGQACKYRRAYVRAKSSGKVTMNAADALASRLLGMHPAEVWGEAWWISPSKSHSPASIDPQDVCGSVNA